MTQPASSALRVLVACGGTGGHIYPGIAVARALEQLGPTEFLFIGTPDRMEAQLIPREGFPFVGIRVQGFLRSFKFAAVLKNLKNLVRLALGLPVWRSLREIRRFRPQVAIGVGGYMSGPALLAAWLCRVPVVVIEPNALPGVTNRLLARFATRIFVAFPETVALLGYPDKTTVSGNPLRSGFLEAVAAASGTSRGRPAELEGLDPALPLVAVVGGSLGAQRLNSAVLELFSGLEDGRWSLPPLAVLHVMGERFYSEHPLEQRFAGAYKRIAYAHNFPHILKSTAVLVCRAGAGTVAEALAVGVPTLLVPWPGATDNHQEHNARALEQAGAARVLLDRECSGERLAALLGEMLEPEAGSVLRERARSFGRPQAAQSIATAIRELLEP